MQAGGSRFDPDWVHHDFWSIEFIDKLGTASRLLKDSEVDTYFKCIPQELQSCIRILPPELRQRVALWGRNRTGIGTWLRTKVLQVQVLSPPPNKFILWCVRISVSTPHCHCGKTGPTPVHTANKFIILYKIIGGSKVPVKYR